MMKTRRTATVAFPTLAASAGYGRVRLFLCGIPVASVLTSQDLRQAQQCACRGPPARSSPKPAGAGSADQVHHLQENASTLKGVDLSGKGYLRLKDVLAVFPVSKAAWYAGIKAGKYPPGVKLSCRSVGWTRASIRSLVGLPS
jgi:predicted DNA-binding transcriptional regulator AlpA